jgi:hypothetical protein
MLNQQRLDTGYQFLDVATHRRHVARIGGRVSPQLDVRIAQQVGGETAQIPFGADVRPRTQQHPHPFGLAQPDEGLDIAVSAVEIEHASTGFVVIPHDVQADAVHSHRLGHPDPVLPILARNAGRVHLAAANLERLAVEQEVLAVRTEREGMAAFEVHGALTL